jgi:hypothetical protein
LTHAGSSLKTDDPKAPLLGQEFYELRLDGSGDICKGRHSILEAQAQWDEKSRQTVWDEVETEYMATLEEATMRYEARRATLVKRGVKYSDMDAF